MQQLTLFDRRLSDWNTEVFDGRWHQQLDLMLISTEYRSCVHDIVSRRSVRIGPTTHYLQVATVMMPIQKRRSPQNEHYAKDSLGLLAE